MTDDASPWQGTDAPSDIRADASTPPGGPQAPSERSTSVVGDSSRPEAAGAEGAGAIAVPVAAGLLGAALGAAVAGGAVRAPSRAAAAALLRDDARPWVPGVEHDEEVPVEADGVDLVTNRTDGDGAQNSSTDDAAVEGGVGDVVGVRFPASSAIDAPGMAVAHGASTADAVRAESDVSLAAGVVGATDGAGGVDDTTGEDGAEAPDRGGDPAEDDLRRTVAISAFALPLRLLAARDDQREVRSRSHELLEEPEETWGADQVLGAPWDEDDEDDETGGGSIDLDDGWSSWSEEDGATTSAVGATGHQPVGTEVDHASRSAASLQRDEASTSAAAPAQPPRDVVWTGPRAGGLDLPPDDDSGSSVGDREEETESQAEWSVKDLLQQSAKAWGGGRRDEDRGVLG